MSASSTTDVKFDIVADEESGRRLFAAARIEAGEAIFTERAYAFAPIPSHLARDCYSTGAPSKPAAAASSQAKAGSDDDDDDDDDDDAETGNEEGFCFHCLRPDVDSSAAVPCDGCAYAFCSAQCKEQLGGLHQHECQLVAPLLSCAAEQNCPTDDLRYLLLAVRTLIQMHVHRRQREAGALTSLPGSDGGCLWANDKLVLALQANVDMHRSYQPELLLNARKLANVLLLQLPAELLAGVTRQQLARLFLLFNVNCYALGEFGVALFFFGALASHSCSQNAAFADDETRPGCKTLRALRTVEPGEELSVSYIGTDLVMPTFLRRRKLLSAQLFWCQCPRCLHPTEQDRLLRCVRCPACSQLAACPLPCPLRPPPATATPSSEDGDADENNDDDDDNDNDNDNDDDDENNNDADDSDKAASSSSGSSDAGQSLDQPDADEVWECQSCKATCAAGDANSPRVAEQKAEELFLAARQLLVDEEGSLSPATVDQAAADKAAKLLAFSLKNANLAPSHYLLHMSRELLHAVYCERQMLLEALDMADDLIASANRVYTVDHVEKGQLYEALAQLCTDAIQAAKEKNDADTAKLQQLRRDYWSQALTQYTTYMGKQSAPSLRIAGRLASDE